MRTTDYFELLLSNESVAGMRDLAVCLRVSASEDCLPTGLSQDGLVGYWC
jgi:hypothetical protein